MSLWTRVLFGWRQLKRNKVTAAAVVSLVAGVASTRYIKALLFWGKGEEPDDGGDSPGDDCGGCAAGGDYRRCGGRYGRTR